MNWTCEQTELYLADYLDGLMQPAQQQTFDLHVNSCERCTPLVASVTHTLNNLHRLPELELPPRFVYKVLDATLGPRESVTGWAAVRAWLRGLASPRFAYGALSLAATYLMIVTVSGVNWKKPKLADLSPVNVLRNTEGQAQRAYARSTKYFSDLRVVYEIQSKLRQDSQLPAAPESTVPESTPQKDPGRTDGTPPAAPRQQNRANDVNSETVMLAAELPLLNENSCFGLSANLSLALMEGRTR